MQILHGTTESDHNPKSHIDLTCTGKDKEKTDFEMGIEHASNASREAARILEHCPGSSTSRRLHSELRPSEVSKWPYFSGPSAHGRFWAVSVEGVL